MIDWNQFWKLSMVASRQVQESGYEVEEIAERYDQSEALRRDGERRAAVLEIDPTWSVLTSERGQEP